MFLPIIVLARTLFTASTSFAQLTARSNITLPKSPLEAPKTELASEDADKLALEELATTNKKMYRDFTRHFKDARDIKVFANGTEFNIYSKAESMRHCVNHSNKGTWRNTMSYYSTDRLPVDIRRLIEDKYPQFTMFGEVIKVQLGGKTGLLVLIENETSWKGVKVVDGELEDYESWQKQK